MSDNAIASCLDASSLEIIFALVCRDSPTHGGQQHVPSIPQVFSRWYDVYTNSLLLWKDVNIDFEAILLPRSFRQRQLAAESIFSWLYRRRHAIQRLTLSGCYLVDDILDGNLYHLTRNAPRLASITLNSCANSRGTTLSFLQAPTLKSVTLTHHQPKSGMYRTMAVDTRSLMSLPCTLPLLQHLNLTLDVFAGSPADLGIISEMPFLTSLKLASRSESMLLLPEVLAGFGRLQRLELENVRMPQMSPVITNALSNITHLSLTSVLAAQPRRKAGLTLWQSFRYMRSLQYLIIKDAGLHADLPGSALACTSLRSLTVLGSKNLNNWQVESEDSQTSSSFFGMASTSANASSAGMDYSSSEVVMSPFMAIQNVSYSNNNAHYSSGSYYFNNTKPYLRELHLQDCSVDFSEIPTYMPVLSNLTSLVWSNIREAIPRDVLVNQLQPKRHMQFPPFVWNLHHLHTLRLEYSGITELPAERATCFPALERLSLEGNPLGWDEWAAFVGVLTREGCLRALSLANTGLERLPDNAEEVLRGLKEVDLGRTLLAWRSGTLAPLARLKGLDKVRLGAAPVSLHVSREMSGELLETGESMFGLIA